MKFLVIILILVAFHIIRKILESKITPAEYQASEEEIKEYLEEKKIIPPEEKIPPSPREESEKPTSQKEAPETLPQGEELISSEILLEAEKPLSALKLDRETLRKVILYQAILGPPRSMEEWECRNW